MMSVTFRSRSSSSWARTPARKKILLWPTRYRLGSSSRAWIWEVRTGRKEMEKGNQYQEEQWGGSLALRPPPATEFPVQVLHLPQTPLPCYGPHSTLRPHATLPINPTPTPKALPKQLAPPPSIGPTPSHRPHPLSRPRCKPQSLIPPQGSSPKT